MEDKVDNQVFFILFKEPGITISEIAEKLNKRRTAISRSVKNLKENDMVTFEYEEAKGQGIYKHVYPYIKYIFNRFGKSMGIKFTDNELKSLNDFFFKNLNKIKKSTEESFDKEKDTNEFVDSFGGFILSFKPYLLEDKELHKEYLSKVQPISKKIQDAMLLNGKKIG